MNNQRTELSRIEYKFGELFCGPGGLSLGAINAKLRYNKILYSIKHTWASDYDSDSCNTYINNICPSNPSSVICDDVKKIDIDKLGEIDGFAYGFPCNDFSIVGEQNGMAGRFGALYTYGIKVIDNYNPLFFVAENVGGLRSANTGGAFKIILNDLAKSGEGYNLNVHLYKAEEYGVPQARHRIIIVGFKKSSGLIFKAPLPTHQNRYITSKNALTKPPIKNDVANNEMTQQSKDVIERLRYIKPGENAWTAKIPKHLQLNVKKTRLSHIYKRLDPTKPAYTITGSGGGGTHVYHWEENRALTNRERARLQTFPDEFVFYGNKESVRKQIGMAVPPKLSQVVFEAILMTIAGKSYPHFQNGNLDLSVKKLNSEFK